MVESITFPVLSKIERFGTMLQVALKNCNNKKKIRKEKLADAAEAVVFAFKKKTRKYHRRLF